MKICKNCKHCLRRNDHKSWLCYAKAIWTVDWITGDWDWVGWSSCSHMRFDADGLCGEDAKLFEPKPWWRFW